MKILNLKGFCAALGMVINNPKTKFMVINGPDKDHQTLSDESFYICNCDSYAYLDSVFTQDGKTTTLENHCKAQLSQLSSHDLKKNKLQRAL